MTRSYICGFEMGRLLDEAPAPAVVGAGPVIESSIVRTGQYSLKVTAGSGAANYLNCGNGSATAGMRSRFYFRVTALPATARMMYGSNAANNVNLLLNPSGTISIRVATTVIGTSTTALTDTNRWYRIEMGEDTGPTAILRIDGVEEVRATATGMSAHFRYFGCFDTVAATYTAYYDDCVDGNEGDGGPFYGAGGIVMLLPTALSAAGGWVEGDGAGTAGMAAAVATRPPPGVASGSETAATNIESATNSATDNCDMTMSTYISKGVTGVVNTVFAVVRNGEDAASGQKSGAMLIVSNPAQGAEDTFVFGNDAGAHGADAGGNWFSLGGTKQVAPTVDLSVAPVLRVGKRTATTSVVCVDFMGIYVDFTPSAVPTIRTPVARGQYVDQAINRAGAY